MASHWFRWRHLVHLLRWPGSLQPPHNRVRPSLVHTSVDIEKSDSHQDIYYHSIIMSTLKYNTWVLIYTPGGAIFTISSTTLLLPPESPSNTGDIPVHYRIQPIQDVTRINAQITFLMHKSSHRGHRTTLIVSILNASTVKTLLPVGCFPGMALFLVFDQSTGWLCARHGIF